MCYCRARVASCPTMNPFRWKNPFRNWGRWEAEEPLNRYSGIEYINILFVCFHSSFEEVRVPFSGGRSNARHHHCDSKLGRTEWYGSRCHNKKCLPLHFFPLVSDVCHGQPHGQRNDSANMFASFHFIYFLWTPKNKNVNLLMSSI